MELALALALQPWVNFGGLVLDFVGLLILAFEWRVAIRAERREAEIAEREEMFRPRPNMPRPSSPHQDVFDDMRARHSFRMRAMRQRESREQRRSLFGFAIVLIVLGFFLQMLGSFPLEAVWPA